MKSRDVIAQLSRVVARNNYAFNPQFIGAIESLAKERVAQDAKWGVQDHSPLQWLPILDEEHGEMAREMLRLCEPGLHDPSGEYDLPREQLMAAYRRELVQMTAVGIAMIESLDRGMWKTKHNASAIALDILNRYDDALSNELSKEVHSVAQVDFLTGRQQAIRQAFVEIGFVPEEELDTF